MIISLRGPSGAGKSHIVHGLLGDSRYHATEQRESGRKKPIGYVLLDPSLRLAARPVFVPGHYEIANGGVDTLRDLDEAYRLIRHYAELGYHVIYEGKNMSDGAMRARVLRDEGHDVRVILLSTSVEKCVASVRRRGHRIAEDSIVRLWHKCRRDVTMMREAKIECRVLSRLDATRQIEEWIGIRGVEAADLWRADSRQLNPPRPRRFAIQA